MMDPLVTIENSQLHVKPGHSASTVISVVNPVENNIVDKYELAIMGPASSWSVIAPTTDGLLPGDRQRISITFQPPDGPLTPTGTLPFAVRLRSQADPDLVCTPIEGDVHVDADEAVDAELLPIHDRARHRARYRLDVVNQESKPIDVAVTVQSEGDSLSFAFAPQRLQLAPNESGSVFLAVRPVKPALFGGVQTLNFTVTLKDRNLGSAVAALVGAFERLPVLPRWLGVALLVAVALIVGVAAATFLQR